MAIPVHSANASARRCIETALTQSPARSGHSTCMRKIFDGPLRPLAPRQAHQDAVYPSLPNVSRQLSRLTRHRESRNAPCRLQWSDRPLDQDDSCMPTSSFPRSLSEPWSEDSIYLSTESLHASPSNATRDDRVRDWLLTAETSDIDIRAETAENLDMHLNGPLLRDCAAVEPNNIIPGKAKTLRSDLTAGRPQTRRQVSDTCETLEIDQSPTKQPHATIKAFRRSRNSTATPAHVYITSPQAQASPRRKVIELKPLSPNVCTNRGCANDQENSIADIIASSPSSSMRLPFRYKRRYVKENVALGNDSSTQGLRKGLGDRKTGSSPNTET